jgi:hypothetical protein
MVSTTVTAGATGPGDSSTGMEQPDTGELVLGTREEIVEHAEADRRALEAAQRYEEKQLRWHRRLSAALRPYGDRTTSVGDAVRQAAADLRIDATDRGFDELASRGPAPGFANGSRSGRSASGDVLKVTE